MEIEKEPNYVFRGGLVFFLVWLATLVLGGASFLFFNSEFNPVGAVLIIFHPIAVFGIGMMGMTGTPPSFTEIATASVIVLAVELGMYIALGCILGFIYGAIKRNTKIKSLGKWLIIFLFMLPLFVILSIFSFERPNHSKIAANNGCDAFYTNFKVFFNRDYCYQTDAFIKRDTSICSKIKEERTLIGIDNNPVVSEDQCYLKIALEKENPEGCDLILNSSEKRASCINEVNAKIELCGTVAWDAYAKDRDSGNSGVWWGGYEDCDWVRDRLNPR